MIQEIYENIYDESFVYGKPASRIKLQAAVYLLENMGLNIGNYSFSWDTHGPRSLKLDCDAQNFYGEEVSFSSNAEEKFARLKGLMEHQTVYDSVNWMECIASLLYLKKVFRLSEKDLIPELEKWMPYLSNGEANKKALSIVKGIKL